MEELLLFLMAFAVLLVPLGLVALIVFRKGRP